MKISVYSGRHVHVSHQILLISRAAISPVPPTVSRSRWSRGVNLTLVHTEKSFQIYTAYGLGLPPAAPHTTSTEPAWLVSLAVCVVALEMLTCFSTTFTGTHHERYTSREASKDHNFYNKKKENRKIHELC